MKKGAIFQTIEVLTDPTHADWMKFFILYLEKFERLTEDERQCCIAFMKSGQVPKTFIVDRIENQEGFNPNKPQGGLSNV